MSPEKEFAKKKLIFVQAVYVIGHAVISPMGNTSEQNFNTVMQQKTAIKPYSDTAIAAEPFFAARLQPDQLQILAARYGSHQQQFSPFEQMCLYAIEEALSETEINVHSEDCVFILSSTKGNIEWLGVKEDARISLHASAHILSEYLGLENQPVVVSNACISGSLALIMGKRMLETGKYKHAIVVGCDRFSSFVFSGFQSFHALADGPCRPFDKDRNGINLGEAAACMILSVTPELSQTMPLVLLAGGAISNDANHLSGPSRTGAELAAAIDQAMAESGIKPSAIGMVSAHGTATLFNDEMEAKALHLSGMEQVPLHSLKSYTGHTLGAAGIIESIMACKAMQQSMLPVSLGYATSGVSTSVAVTTQMITSDYQYLLKTASGFGGCNAALIWQKVV